MYEQDPQIFHDRSYNAVIEIRKILISFSHRNIGRLFYCLNARGQAWTKQF